MSLLCLQYYAESHAVIYIVDSSDKDRIDESKDAFGKQLFAFPSLQLLVGNPCFQDDFFTLEDVVYLLIIKIIEFELVCQCLFPMCVFQTR